MSNSETHVRVKCDCGCCMIEFTRYDWDDGETDYNISVLDSRYDHNVNGLLGRVRRAFGVLVGKPVYFNDAFMNSDKFDSMLNALTDLRDSSHADG